MNYDNWSDRQILVYMVIQQMRLKKVLGWVFTALVVCGGIGVFLVVIGVIIALGLIP